MSAKKKPDPEERVVFPPPDPEEIQAAQRAAKVISSLVSNEEYKAQPLNRPLAPRQPPAEGEIRFRTSLPVATREDKMRVYRAQISQDKVLRDMLGQTMQVRDWITHDWTGVDDTTGEVRAGIRSVLVCEDGQLIAAVSDGIVACLHALIGWAGPAPWRPPLSLKCVEHRSSRSPDRRYYLLEPV